MHDYRRVAGEDLSDDGDAEHALNQPRTWGGKSSRRCSGAIWILQTLFFLFSCLILLSGLKLRHKSSGTCRDLDYEPQWSPVLEAVKGTGHLHRFDGSFATPNEYKGTPTPLIDGAWDRVLMANGGVISIDEETLRKINGSQEYSVKLAPEIGGGYMASVEVLHQLHCLNMLRQATYENYYKDKAEPWEDSPQILRYHLDHCIDNLRQKLMCEADTGVLTYVWVKDHPAPFPDFNVQHKCRNIEGILDWVSEHQIFTKEGHRVQRQPGSKELETPP